MTPMEDATNLVEPQVGRRIRDIRELHGLSLKALAERSKLSINAISRIERGENSPTVTTLHRLAAALDVPITDFFGQPGTSSIVLVRSGERARVDGDGVVLESLGSGLPGQRLEPFLMTLQPQAASGCHAVEHAGEEFAICLEGEVEYSIGQQRVHLNPHDALLFLAQQPHICRNLGQEPARVLFVIRSPDPDDRRAHQVHLMNAGAQQVQAGTEAP